jgi:hypothetical protein
MMELGKGHTHIIKSLERRATQKPSETKPESASESLSKPSSPTVPASVAPALEPILPIEVPEPAPVLAIVIPTPAPIAHNKEPQESAILPPELIKEKESLLRKKAQIEDGKKRLSDLVKLTNEDPLSSKKVTELERKLKSIDSRLEEIDNVGNPTKAPQQVTVASALRRPGSATIRASARKQAPTSTLQRAMVVSEPKTEFELIENINNRQKISQGSFLAKV